jgi:hypothetical protein
MAICHFCHREFVNRQAVRAHLRVCEPYLNRDKGEPEELSLKDENLKAASLAAPSLDGAPREGRDSACSGEFDPIRQLDQQIAAEQRRLKLRELQQAHEDLDRQAAAREREQQIEVDKQAETSRAAQRARDAADQRERQTREAREAAANALQEKQRRHRQVIQDVKQVVVERWSLGAWISLDLKARILLEIERLLGPLALDELPRDEVVQIAQAARDRLHEEARRAEQHAQRKAQERAERRKRLQQHGLDYLKRELRDAEGLSGLKRLQIELRVSRELEAITGDEASDDIEDWIEDFLEREGIEYDDDGED